jgi:hypothetical protein
MFVNCCHCSDCQRQVGSAFVINALIETDRIEILSGEVARPAMPDRSPAVPHLCLRCPRCGTTIWSDYGDRKVLSFLRRHHPGRPRRAGADVHIFTARSCRGCSCRATCRPSSLLRHGKLWPAESLARRKALGVR